MAEEYFDSVLRHAEQCVEELDELGTISQDRRWTRLEQRAAERSLQLLVEACIGVAKRWVKHLGLTVPLDAYPCFEKLAEKGLIAPHPPDAWRKIVGLRNVLVHDYLNVDPDVIRDVIEHKYYLELLAFIRSGKSAVLNGSCTER